MQIYLIAPPNSPKRSKSMIAACQKLLLDKKHRVRIHSSMDESCVQVAREIARSIGLRLEDCALSQKGEETEELIMLIIMTSGTADTFARWFNPDCKVVPVGALFNVNQNAVER